MAQRIQIRRDRQVVWDLINPILAHGEMGFVQEPGEQATRLKIGNGVDTWSNLEYFCPDIDLSIYATWSEVASISGSLEADIYNETLARIAADALLTPLATTAAISGSLQSQIDAIEQESTMVTSVSGSILVTQNGNTFNVEVASAPIQDHNSLSGLNAGDYKHLTSTEYADRIGRVEVSSISGSLQAQINNEVSNRIAGDTYIISQVSSISGSLQSQIDAIVEEGTVITSTDGSVGITQNGLVFDVSIAAISGALTSQINGKANVVHSHSISDVTGLQNTLDTKANIVDVAAISGSLQSQIDAIIVPDVSDFITYNEVASISGSLQSQIDAIEQESTMVTSVSGSILVTQNGNTFNVEVASAPIQNHNDLNGLNVGDYKHLTAAQYADYIGASTVASISGDLQSQINNLDSIYATDSMVASISGNLQSQINAIPTYETGIQVCSAGVTTYTITHSSVNTAVKRPYVSLKGTAATDEVFALMVYDTQATSFKVVVSGPPTTNHSIIWSVV